MSVKISFTFHDVCLFKSSTKEANVVLQDLYLAGMYEDCYWRTENTDVERSLLYKLCFGTHLFMKPSIVDKKLFLEQRIDDHLLQCKLNLCIGQVNPQFTNTLSYLRYLWDGYHLHAMDKYDTIIFMDLLCRAFHDCIYKSKPDAVLYTLYNGMNGEKSKASGAVIVEAQNVTMYIGEDVVNDGWEHFDELQVRR